MPEAIPSDPYAMTGAQQEFSRYKKILTGVGTGYFVGALLFSSCCYQILTDQDSILSWVGAMGLGTGLAYIGRGAPAILEEWRRLKNAAAQSLENKVSE